MMRLRVLAAAAVLAVAAPAFAQTDPQSDQPATEQGQQHHAMSPEAREALKKACGSDIQTYCGDAEKGGGRVGRCLRDNFDKLSGDCQTQLKAMRSQWRRPDPSQSQAQPQPQPQAEQPQ
jgi:uncharacterized low-complexity protein